MLSNDGTICEHIFLNVVIDPPLSLNRPLVSSSREQIPESTVEEHRLCSSGDDIDIPKGNVKNQNTH